LHILQTKRCIFAKKVNYGKDNLQGKRIYLGNYGNYQILKIPVQTKGMSIVKVSFGSVKKALWDDLKKIVLKGLTFQRKKFRKW
jgi:hypothetical protein